MSGVVVAALEEMQPGTARKFDVAGRLVAVVRIGDDVYAIGDTCSHGNVSLSEGEVLGDDLELECWKHGSTFSLLSGEPMSLPATQPVPVYVATVVDGDIVIDVDTAPGRDADPTVDRGVDRDTTSTGATAPIENGAPA